MPRLTLFNLLTWLLNRLIPLTLGLVALVGLWWLGQLCEPKVLDLLQRWGAKPASDSPVVLVLLDNESLVRLRGRFGPAPWTRETLLEILKRVNAAQPATLALDGHFASTDRVQDARVFERLRQFPNLVIGTKLPESTVSTEENALPRLISTDEPLNMGVVSIPEDSDGVIRSLRLYYGRYKRKNAHNKTFIAYPSFALATAIKYQKEEERHFSRYFWGLPYTPSPKSEESFERSVPLSQPSAGKPILISQVLRDEWLTLRWSRPLKTSGEEGVRTHEAIPLYRFFDSAPPPKLDGKIALIGASASYYQDYHHTPLSNHHLGPDIQATAIDNLLVTLPVITIPGWENLLLLLVLSSIIFWFCVVANRLNQAFLMTTGIVVFLFWAAVQSFVGIGFWWEVSTKELFIVAAFLMGLGYRTRHREKQLGSMEKTLAQLVDPGVLREIHAHGRLGDRLKPGGEKLEITSLFVDIRQFTALSERLQPAELTALLNAFYEAVVAVVFQHQGTVDKFMGDGILVFFGAPLPRADHAIQALRAAMDLLQATDVLCQQWHDTQQLHVEIGISLHSGIAFVGFLGPIDKLEYTAVGDTVNTCIRLQEVLKTFQTRLIVSQQTLQAESAAQVAIFESLGEVQLRGREASLQVYTIDAARIR